jgi:hypothetical protein
MARAGDATVLLCLDHRTNDCLAVPLAGLEARKPFNLMLRPNTPGTPSGNEVLAKQ